MTPTEEYKIKKKKLEIKFLEKLDRLWLRIIMGISTLLILLTIYSMVRG